MRRTPVFLMVAAVAVAGCSGGAPAATPTKAPPAVSPTATVPPAPAKAAEPTKAPAAAAALTAAPKKVDFPEKGNAITIIVPCAAGGANDSAARLLAPGLEKELGVPV